MQSHGPWKLKPEGSTLVGSPCSQHFYFMKGRGYENSLLGITGNRMAGIIFARVKKTSKRLKDAIKKYNSHIDVLEQCGNYEYPRCDIRDAKDMTTVFWERHDQLSGIVGSMGQQRAIRKAIDAFNIIRRCDEEIELLSKEMRSVVAIDEERVSALNRLHSELSNSAQLQQSRFLQGHLLHLNVLLEEARNLQTSNRAIIGRVNPDLVSAASVEIVAGKPNEFCNSIAVIFCLTLIIHLWCIKQMKQSQGTLNRVKVSHTRWMRHGVWITERQTTLQVI
jgi:hypothetical protein